MNRASAWLTTLSVGTLMGTILWSLREHIDFEGTLFNVMMGVWG